MEEEFYNQNEFNDDIDENNPQSVNELNALQKILHLLKPFDRNSVKKIIKTVLTFYDLEITQSFGGTLRKEINSNKESKFSENRDTSPKDFMMEKNPQTDVERIAYFQHII